MSGRRCAGDARLINSADHVERTFGIVLELIVQDALAAVESIVCASLFLLGSAQGGEPAVIESGHSIAAALEIRRRMPLSRTWQLSLSLLLHSYGRLPCLCTLFEHHLPARRISLERLLSRPQLE
jgi:hypothetical protein